MSCGGVLPVFAVNGALPSRAIDQQVAVAHPGVVFPVRIATLVVLQHFDQRLPDIVWNLAGGEAPHDFVDHGDEVAPHGPVFRPEFIAPRLPVEARPV